MMNCVFSSQSCVVSHLKNEHKHKTFPDSDMFCFPSGLKNTADCIPFQLNKVKVCPFCKTISVFYEA